MIYIIILNYNGYIDTLECLQSIFKSNYKKYKIILIDNNSSDNSIHFFKEWFLAKGVSFSNQITKPIDNKNVLIVPLDNNLGYAGGNNVGIRLASKQKDCQYIWILG